MKMAMIKAEHRWHDEVLSALSFPSMEKIALRN